MKALINPLQYHRVIEPLILIVRPDIHQLGFLVRPQRDAAILDVQCLGGPHGATTSNEIEFAADDVLPLAEPAATGTHSFQFLLGSYRVLWFYLDFYERIMVMMVVVIILRPTSFFLSL